MKVKHIVLVCGLGILTGTGVGIVNVAFSDKALSASDIRALARNSYDRQQRDDEDLHYRNQIQDLRELAMANFDEGSQPFGGAPAPDSAE